MPQKPQPGKHGHTRVGRLGPTVLVVAVALLLILVGRSALDTRLSSAELPAPLAPQAVAVARLELLDGYATQRAFTGQLEPAQRTDLGFEVGGTLADILVDEGDAVTAGEPMARLDRRLLKAERLRLLAARQAVAAQAELASRTSERQATLQQRGFASAQALDAASLGLAELTARLAELDAAVAAVDIRLEKAVLLAPFAGRVAARHIDEGGSAGPGQSVVTLVAIAEPVFRVGVSPDALHAMPDDGTVDIDFDGVPHARLRSVLPELDALTRTRTVLFQLLDTAPPAYRETGTLRLTADVETRGAWVPLAALTNGPRGLWRLYTVIDRGGEAVIGTETVEIIHATAERAFVRGTFQAGAVFITDGTHRVVPGQSVRAVGGAG